MAERAQLATVEVSEEVELSAEHSEEVLRSRVRLHAVHGPIHAHPTPHGAREVALLVLASVLLHGGAAYGFYGGDHGPEPSRRSKVQIEITRPATPPQAKPTPPPPPPPPAAPEKTKALAKPEAAVPPSAEPAAAPAAPSEAVDTGSSAEAADDGNLAAGSGGLGVGPVAPVVAAPVAPVAAPVVQAHEGANYSKNPRPAYPGRAKREGWEGKVLVRVQIQANGRPGAMKVQKSSGRSLLDEAALEAIKSWSFVPAKQGGESVVGWVTVPIVFRLQ